MIKKKKSMLFGLMLVMIAAIAMTFAACSCGGGPAGPYIPEDTKDLEISDEKLADFSKGFATAKFEASDGWTNGEPFNVYWKKSNVNIDGDNLTMEITERPEGAYYAGEYRSVQHYRYGDYSVKLKPMKQLGVASAFFTYTGDTESTDGVPNPHDEIDIEFLGKDTTKVQFNYFINGQGGHEYHHDLGFDASEEFHEYGFRWSEDSITWFVDGKPVYYVNESPSTPGRIMLNSWCGTQSAYGWMGEYKGVEAGNKYSIAWIDSTAEPIGEENKVPSGELPVDPAEGTEPVAITFSTANQGYTVTNAADNKSMQVTYNSFVNPNYAQINAMPAGVSSNNVFVVKIKNNGETTPTVRINLNDSSIVPDYSVIKTSAKNLYATQDGALVTTDQEWGGSYFNSIPAGEEIIVAVYYGRGADTVEFMIDSTLNGGQGTYSGDLTFSEYKFASVEIDEEDGEPEEPEEPGEGEYLSLTFANDGGAYTFADSPSGKSVRVNYTDLPGNSYANLFVTLPGSAVGTTFSLKLQNHSANNAVVRFDMLSAVIGGDKLATAITTSGGTGQYVSAGEAYVTIPGEATITVQITMSANAKAMTVFLDSTTAGNKTGGVTFSDFLFN